MNHPHAAPPPPADQPPSADQPAPPRPLGPLLPKGLPTQVSGPSSALAIHVGGAVQGVGFRPFVHALATGLGLVGVVRNTGAGVDVEVEGPGERLQEFVRRLVDDAPPLALVESVSTRVIEARERTEDRVGFVIAPSLPGERVETLVTADAATCDRCLAEILDPADRRYRYPFTNCTDCGPRFTIIQAVPYDRPHTTMAGFTMCAACRAEYDDPADRRFHAQPNACPACGPRLRLVPTGLTPGPTGSGRAPIRAADGDDALQQAAEVIRRGGILALKGLGGYHLACDATDPAAVALLRARKGRDEKPFAVMLADLDEVGTYCELSEQDAAVLSSARRPIVLLERLPGGADLPEGVAPGVTTYGVLLPYTPLHHLLVRDIRRPLVMTSGNVSDEPIAYRDDDARARLSTLADAILSHDRPIHIRTDDSVVRTFKGRQYPIRRARGFAPLPVRFSGSDRRILAVGAHLKNSFCITRGDHAFVSHHIGDLETVETLLSLQEGVAHLERLFDLRPDVIAHDLHPDHLSTRFAQSYAERADLPLVPVQHHEAHIASVLAETGYAGEVVGVAFDGAGLGRDGMIWGGEFFVGRAGSLVRVAHLALQSLPGGDAAVRQPWRLAVTQLAAALQIELPRDGDDSAALDALASRLLRLPAGERFADHPWRTVLRAAGAGINTPLTTSAGRLFDTVAALLGFRHEVAYEGQAAILLETGARRHLGAGASPPTDAPGPWSIPAPWRDMAIAPHHAAGPVAIPVTPFVRGVLDDLEAGRSPDEVAARFHHALATTTADVTLWAAERHGAAAAAFSGGVFQNLLFLDAVVTRVEAAGLRALVHRSVPTNDGGLCLGQAETAAALLREQALGPRPGGRPS